MFETQPTRRLTWLLWLMLAWVAVIFGRLVMLQVFQHDKLLKAAEQQQQKKIEIAAVRGTIFDRNGQPLAKTLPAESICVNPMKIPDVGVAADILSRVLDLDRKPLYARLASAKEHKSGFIRIAFGIPALHVPFAVEDGDQIEQFEPTQGIVHQVILGPGPQRHVV